MMSYETFKKVAEEEFVDHMPKKYQEYELMIIPVKKINHIVDGLVLKGNESENITSPTLYVENMYKEYRYSRDINVVLKRAANKMVKAFQKITAVPEITKEQVKDNIIFRLINTQQNCELLKEIPHREFLDLSVIYIWILDSKAVNFLACLNDEEMATSIIDYKMADFLGFDEKDLFKLAFENTRKSFPPVVHLPSSILPKSDPDNPVMYMISNEKFFYGAAAMLYEDRFYDLAMELNSDLYVIPSSVNEVIALPTYGVDVEEIAELVNVVNKIHVDLEERLSNQVYLYDRKMRRIIRATDTANKSLSYEGE